MRPTQILNLSLNHTLLSKSGLMETVDTRLATVHDVQKIQSSEINSKHLFVASVTSLNPQPSESPDNVFYTEHRRNSCGGQSLSRLIKCENVEKSTVPFVFD